LSQGCGIPASEEISVEPVAGGVTVGENKRLLALALSPSAGEQGGVPVDFVEEVREVSVARRAVAIDGPGHVVLVVIDAFRIVEARREVNIGTER
jgi:hypothetical protein